MIDRQENNRTSQREEIESQSIPNSHINYHSNSLKKLKKITNEIVINTQSSRRVQSQIQSNRLKKAGEEVMNEFKRSNTQKQKYNHGQISRKQDDISSKNSKLMQVTQSLKNSSGAKNLLYNEQLSRDMKMNSRQRVHTQSFKDECIIRDKYKNPIKYKITAMEKGIDDEKIYNMKEGQFSKIQQQYTKKKGLQYLREGRRVNSIRTRLKTQPAKNIRGSSQNIRNYEKSQIHKLFGGAETKIKKRLSQKTLKKTIKAQYIEQLKQQQCILGKIVFQKVKKHLKQDKSISNYFKRVHNEDVIDDALVKFLKVRIQRADAMISK